MESCGISKGKSLRKTVWFCGVCFFFFFLVLAYLFPYTGDDWAWGTKIGIERLSSFFQGYNGRYAGNLLVLLLTRSNIIKALVMSVASVVLCMLACKYCDANEIYIFILSFVFYLLMPKRILAQALVWTSGFSNYVPPAVLSFAYICMVKRTFENKKAAHPVAESVFCFILSFVGGLFIENITLFNVFMAGMVLLLSVCKFKAVFSSHVSYAVGAVLSCVLMFVNPAYLSIFSGNDDYRSLSNESGGILVTIKEHSKISLKYLIIDNYIICVIIGILLLFLAIKRFKSLSNVRKLWIIPFGIVLFMSSVCLGINAFHCYPGIQYKVAVAYFLAVFGVTFCITEKNRMIKAFTPLIASVVLVAPLLVTNPIGPRCFFFSYFFMIVFLLELLSDFECKNRLLSVSVTVISIVAFALIAVYLFTVFTEIRRVDNERNQYAKQMSDANETVCEFCSLPNRDYLHCSEVDTEPWNTRYKLFYDLNENMVFQYYNQQEFEEIMNNR